MKRLMVLGAALTLFPLAGYGQESLADLARRTREQRGAANAAPTTPKVYTNNDLKADSFLSVVGQRPQDVPAPATTTVARAAEPGEAARADEDRRLAGRDEAYWRGRLRELTTQLDNDRTVLADAMAREKAIDKEVHRSVDDVLYIRDGIRRGVLERQWQDLTVEVSRLEAAVQNGMRARSNLELEAHAAGVPPGWLVLP